MNQTPIINLSIIEEEDKQMIDRTYVLNSISDREVKLNFSGLQDEKLRNSSSNSLRILGNFTPKLQKKSSYDAHHHKKPNLALDIIGDEENRMNLRQNKQKSLSDSKKAQEKNSNSMILKENEISVNNVKENSMDSLVLARISSQNDLYLNKNQKFMNELKNFVRKKWSLSEFEQVLLAFFQFEQSNFSENLNDQALLANYSNIWLFFFKAMQIVLYLHKETKSLMNKLMKNIKDSNKIKDSFTKYQKNEEISEYFGKKKWKGYLEELMKCEEIYEEIKAKLKLIINFLEGSLEKFNEEKDEEKITGKVSENEKFTKIFNDEKIDENFNEEKNNSEEKNNKFTDEKIDKKITDEKIDNKKINDDITEVFINEKVMEIFGLFESNLKLLNSFSGLTTFSEERLLILSKIPKKESFINFIEFFTENVKKQHQNDLKDLLTIFTRFLNKILKIINFQGGNLRNCVKNINEISLQLTELTTIFSKKVQNLFLLKKSTYDKLSSISLPFYENLDKNVDLLETCDKTFSRILHKISKLIMKIKYLRENFENNLFLSLREKQAILLISELKQLRVEINEEIAILPYFSEFPNYELEILKIQDISSQYQADFQTNESKEAIRDKVIFLSGKLHNLRVFLKQLSEKNLQINSPLLKILQNSIEIQLNSTYKLYDFLLKILNSAHSSELQKIKLIESGVSSLFEALEHYYESFELPISFLISEKFIEMKAFKLELENYSLLLDLPGIYREICTEKITKLEIEIEKLTVFEDLRENGKEKIDNNRIRNVVLSLKYEKKSLDLSDLIIDYEKTAKIAKYIPKIHGNIKTIIKRMTEILDVLKVFEEVYMMFFDKFLGFSDNYEEVKRIVASYHEVLLEKLQYAVNLSHSKHREDRQFFLQCAEFFFINTKNYFQGLIPENIEHIYNQTSHLLREIRGKIDSFYENRENLKVMAIGHTRQINIVKAIDQYLKILEKLNDMNEENQKPQKIKITKENLLKLKGIVELILKPCEVAVNFEDFLDDLIKNKSLKMEQRIDKLKEMLKNLNEKLRSLELEERKIIKDEKIASIYVYVKDDIKKVNDYITRLLPDIEELVYFHHLFESNRIKLSLDEGSMEIIKKLLDFKQKIDKTNEANQPLVFHDRNKINDFIQEYYFYWYQNILRFFQLFDFEAIIQIIHCFSLTNAKALQKIYHETESFYDKIEKRYQKNKNLLTLEAKEVRHNINFLKNSVQQIELGIFTLNHIKIDPIKYKKTNRIQGLKEFSEVVFEKFSFENWKEICYGSQKICDKFCGSVGNNAIARALFLKELKNFKEKFKGLDLKGAQKNWVEVIVKCYEQV